MTGIVILICTTLSGFLIGTYVKNKMKRKLELYRDASNYVSLMLNNVNSKQIVVSKFNDEFCCGCSETFANYLRYGKLICLTKNEKTQLTKFFEGLDCNSKSDCVSHLAYYGKVFEKDYEQLNAVADKQMNVYPKIGLLIGLAVGLLLM